MTNNINLCITDVLVVLLFVVLAVKFNLWWISLFSIAACLLINASICSYSLVRYEETNNGEEEKRVL